jgi:hypothetical protein
VRTNRRGEGEKNKKAKRGAAGLGQRRGIDARSAIIIITHFGANSI